MTYAEFESAVSLIYAVCNKYDCYALRKLFAINGYQYDTLRDFTRCILAIDPEDMVEEFNNGELYMYMELCGYKWGDDAC